MSRRGGGGVGGGVNEKSELVTKSGKHIKAWLGKMKNLISVERDGGKN